MRADLLLEHAALHPMTRREAVELSAKVGAAGALAGLGLGGQSATDASGRFTDEMFDVDAVLDGAWDDTAFYRCEAIVTDRLAEDRVFEFVYIVTPQLASGATAGNTPACALGQPS